MGARTERTLLLLRLGSRSSLSHAGIALELVGAVSVRTTVVGGCREDLIRTSREIGDIGETDPEIRASQGAT